MVDGEGRNPGQRQHIDELDGRPLPTVGLAVDNGDGRCALHGEGKKDHQRQRATQRHVVMQRGLQAESLGVGFGAVERAHRADHHLTGRNAR